MCITHITCYVYTNLDQILFLVNDRVEFELQAIRSYKQKRLIFPIITLIITYIPERIFLASEGCLVGDLYKLTATITKDIKFSLSSPHCNWWCNWLRSLLFANISHLVADAESIDVTRGREGKGGTQREKESG